MNKAWLYLFLAEFFASCETDSAPWCQIDCTSGYAPNATCDKCVRSDDVCREAMSVDRNCVQADDCQTAIHVSNCCGSLQALGIARRASAEFDAREQECRDQYPPCTCAPGDFYQLDNGTVDWRTDPTASQLRCNAGRCETFAN